MKLIVQIPCYNEELTLPDTVADIPRTIEGVDQIEILIVDDGSSDRTVEVARGLGIDHIVRNKRNLGLARTFMNGIEACLRLGADIIVNTDGDNQYVGADIPKLIAPILAEKADIVIGDRQTDNVQDFSPLKKLLQRVGSRVVSQLSGFRSPDTVSGFRAYTREAATALNVVSGFSYTIETIMQASSQRFAIVSVPIRTNPHTRPSRLFKSIPQFVSRQLNTLIRMYAMYRPLRAFAAIGLVLTLIGLVPILRFLYFAIFAGAGSGGHIQSLILGGVFLVLGFVTFIMALLADLIGGNRKLIERALEKIHRVELAMRVGPPSNGRPNRGVA